MTGVIYGIKLKGEESPFYVGQTRQRPETRWRKHMRGRTAVAKALQLFGAAECFDFYVIEYVEVERLNEREAHWIAAMGTLYPRGLNLTAGGGSGKRSAATCVKLSASNKAAFADPERRAEIAARTKDLWLDEDFRSRVQAGMKDAWDNPERRETQAGHQKRRWADPEKRAKQVARMKALWSDPDYRARQLAKKQGQFVCRCPA